MIFSLTSVFIPFCHFLIYCKMSSHPWLVADMPPAPTSSLIQPSPLKKAVCTSTFCPQCMLNDSFTNLCGDTNFFHAHNSDLLSCYLSFGYSMHKCEFEYTYRGMNDNLPWKWYSVSYVREDKQAVHSYSHYDC